MFTLNQRLSLMVLRMDGPLTLDELLPKIPTGITRIGLVRVVNKLKRGNLVFKKKKGKYAVTKEGKNCMRSQGAEFAASEKLNQKK